VYEDSYQPQGSGLQRFLRALSASFRLAHLFGVEVRMFWLALLIPLISIWGFSSLVGVVPWGTILGLSLVFSVGLFVVIYTHEMSHIAAGWRYGISTRLITLGPLGGLAHMDAPAPRPSAEAVIALAGPAVHLVWLAVVAPLWWWSDAIFGLENWEARVVVDFFWQVNVALAIFNLLPFYPMDGGRVLRAALATRINANRATVLAARVGMVGAVLIGLYGLYEGEVWGMILVAIGISNFMACQRAAVAARYQASPYGAPSVYRAAWEADPEAWKHGGESYAPDSDAPGEAAAKPRPGPGRLRSWLGERRQRQQKELAEELDRILAKINAEGMDALTRAERRTLDRASRAAREKR
jgi:Zn-dependent protease